MTTLSARFFKRGIDFLGCDYPIICGAMTWVSDPRLVSTVCNEGAFACLAGGSMPPDLLKKQMEETRRLTPKPFAVNLVTLSPNYREQFEMLLDNPPQFMVFAGGIPRDRDIAAIKAVGSKTICFASSNAMAHRLVSYGADALVLEGMEAGGHVGQVSLTVLLQQVLKEMPPVPVFVAGGIVCGWLAAHLFMIGASGIQLGTRFAVSTESCAHPNFKQAYLNANTRDAVVSAQFDPRLPVKAVRALHNRGTIDFDRLQLDMIGKINDGELTRVQAQHELERFWTGGLRRAVQEGDVDSGSMMAGQSVGLLTSVQPVHDIITGLLQDIEAELQRTRDILH